MASSSSAGSPPRTSEACGIFGRPGQDSTVIDIDQYSSGILAPLSPEAWPTAGIFSPRAVS